MSYTAKRRERGTGNRALVCLPLLDTIFADFFCEYDRLEIPSQRTIKMRGAYVHDAHNQIVREALQRRDWEGILFLEQDHTGLPMNLLERVASYPPDLHIVAAPYVLRRPPHQPAAMMPRPEHDRPEVWAGDWEQDKLHYIRPSLLIDWLNQGQVYRVSAVGMGCTFVRREVFERFPEGEPWFQCPYVGDQRQHMTDDVWFCRRATQLGFQVYLDCGMPIDHLAVRPLGVADHLAWLEQRAREQGLLPAS